MIQPAKRTTLPGNFLRGLVMGSADIVPGISGGTVALIVGIYGSLVYSIRSIASAAVLLLRGRRTAAAERFKDAEWRLLIPLGLGLLIALRIGAYVIPPLLERYPERSLGLFSGLILATLPVPWKLIREVRPVHYVLALAAAAAAFLLAGIPPREIADPSLIFVFIAAAIAICAMILPGISGSFLLLVMGVYTATLNALNDADVLYIAVFILGAAIGIGSFSGLLDHLLKRYHDTTMAVLVGLMAGSLRALWPWQSEDRALLAPGDDVAAAILFALMGLVVVGLLIWLGARAERKQLSEPPSR